MRRFGRDAGDFVLATVDQALLSAMSLGTVVLFIHSAPKEEYGRYTLVNGLVLLATGMQAALVTTPLTALGSRLGRAERNEMVATVFDLQSLLALALGGLLALGIRFLDGDRWLAAAAALAVAGAFLREYQRTADYLDRAPGRVLIGDLAYVALAAAGLVAAMHAGHALRAPAVLAAVGGAALVSSLGLLRRRNGARHARAVARRLLDDGRWTLPGMAVTWAQNTGYSYVVALMCGSAAVAELAAARLFIMPINLVVAAWTRIFLPRAGALLASGGADGGEAGLRALARRSLRLLLVLSLTYLLAPGAFFWLGGGRLLPSKYAGLAPFVFAWCCFFVVSATRSVASTSLLAHSAFRLVFGFSVAAAVTSLALMPILIRLIGQGGAVCALVGGELVLSVLAWRALMWSPLTAAPIAPEIGPPLRAGEG